MDKPAYILVLDEYKVVSEDTECNSRLEQLPPDEIPIYALKYKGRILWYCDILMDFYTVLDRLEGKFDADGFSSIVLVPADFGTLYFNFFIGRATVSHSFRLKGRKDTHYVQWRIQKNGASTVAG